MIKLDKQAKQQLMSTTSKISTVKYIVPKTYDALSCITLSISTVLCCVAADRSLRSSVRVTMSHHHNYTHHNQDIKLAHWQFNQIDSSMWHQMYDMQQWHTCICPTSAALLTGTMYESSVEIKIVDPSKHKLNAKQYDASTAYKATQHKQQKESIWHLLTQHYTSRPYCKPNSIYSVAHNYVHSDIIDNQKACVIMTWDCHPYTR